MPRQNKKPAGGPAPSPTDKTGSSEKSVSKVETLLNILKYALLLFVLDLLQEIIGALTGFYAWSFIHDGMIAVFSLILTIILGLLPVINDKDKKAFFTAIQRPDGIGSWQYAKTFCKKAYTRYIKHNILIFLAFWFSGLLCLPAYGASIGAVRRTFQAGAKALQFASDFLTPTLPPEEASDIPDNTQTVETTPIEPSFPLPSAGVVIPSLVPETDDPPAVSEKKLPPLEQRLVLQSRMPYEVSEEEHGQVFFLAGEHAIEDWSDQNHVQEAVDSFVQSQRKLRRNPKPDKTVAGAQDYLGSVSDASAAETLMLEHERPTTDQLQSVIDTRVAAYDSLPFYDLAIRTRESFCMWGDAIRWQNGTLEDAVVLFTKSVCYGFEALQYDVDEAAFKDDLGVLSERYEKLAYSFPAGSDERQHAFCLSEAFEALSME